MKRLLIGVLALAPALAGAQQPQLYGRWRAVETKVQMADGTTSRQAGPCIAEYDQDKTTSECDMGEGRKSRVVARLHNVTASSYEIEVIESSTAPKSVGAKNKVDYRIEGDRLTVSAKPANAGATVTRIETTLVRE